jgi:hypothetical protein
VGEWVIDFERGSPAWNVFSVGPPIEALVGHRPWLLI